VKADFVQASTKFSATNDEDQEQKQRTQRIARDDEEK